MDIRLLLVIPVLLAGVIVKAIYDNITEKKKTEAKLSMQWGRQPDMEYKPGKLDSIKKYYDSIAEEGDVDDITWNDLDMDYMFMMLNNTRSAMGEEVLYAMLRKPLTNKAEINQRNNLIEHFTTDASDRNNLLKCLLKIGRNDRLSFYEIFSRVEEIKKENNAVHYLINAVWIISITGMFFATKFFILLFVLNLFFTIITYYKRKAGIDMYYMVFNYILRMLYAERKITGLHIEPIDKEISMLKRYDKELSSFRRFSGVVFNPNGGNLLDIFFDYIRMTTHIDLIKFNNMLGTVIEKKDIILNIYRIIGSLDAMISTASYRKLKEDTGICTPEIDDNTHKKYIDTEDIYHPFLEAPVYNSIYADGGVLITGSNASGKSTFLKAVAINAILAQSIATVNAKNYRACCFRIMTSMALADNITDSRSYFIVEIMSLKRILSAKSTIPVLCCIDEVLRGTNTIERISASSCILDKLNNENVLCFAATHDIELTGMLKNSYSNYHFQERIDNDNIIFDYRLYPGAAITRNAIRLLSVLGYDKDIVSRAGELADAFEETGIWNEI